MGLFKRRDGSSRFNTRRNGRQRTFMGKLWRKAALGIGAAGAVVGGIAAAPIVGPALASAGIAAKGALVTAAGGAAGMLKNPKVKDIISQATGGAVEKIKEDGAKSIRSFVGLNNSRLALSGSGSGNVSGNIGGYDFSVNSGNTTDKQGTTDAKKPLVTAGLALAAAKIFGIFK
jgi:hypothetical protein